MNKKILTALTAVACCGVLAFTAFPLVPASADGLFLGSDITEDYIDDCGYSCLGLARSTMYTSNTVLTFNTTTVYNYSDNNSMTQIMRHTDGMNNYCAERYYFDPDITWGCTYLWYEAWFTAGEKVLTLEWNKALLPYAPDKIGDCTFYTPNYQFTINLRGYVHNKATGRNIYFTRTGMTYTDSFDLHSVVLGAAYAANDPVDYNGYLFFEKLIIDFVPTVTSTDDSACSINVDYDGFGTGYTDYLSTLNGYYNSYFYGNSAGGDSGAGSTFEYAFDIVRGFLETEFLPDFSFGQLLLIAMGVLVLGIGLKFSFGG